MSKNTLTFAKMITILKQNSHECEKRKKERDMQSNRSRETMQRCEQCGDLLLPGDDYFESPTGVRLCPDCMEAALRRWKRWVGDTVERV